MPAETLEQIVSLCKRRGFVFPGSAVYGGFANSWDYGPLGVELKNNIKRQWWLSTVHRRDDVEGIDCALIMNPKVWVHSGHVATFSDPLVDNKKTNKRYRLDHLLEAQTDHVKHALMVASGAKDVAEAVHRIVHGAVGSSQILNDAKVTDPDTNEPGDWTPPRQFNLMFDTHIGPIKDDDHKAYLRPETAQGMFVNFNNVLNSMRRKLPFGVAQAGRSFRNEITPGNFIFRQREFEQMEIEYFCMPADAERLHREWIDYRINWWRDLGIPSERLRERPHAKDELAHYAAACSDIEYRFPGSLGWNELEGIANRTNYDLTAHSKDNEVVAEARAKFKMEQPNTDSVETLTFYDAESKQHVLPFVVEPAAGVDRAFLVFLSEAYNEEQVGEIAEADAKAVTEALEAFLKSTAKNEDLGAEKKAEIAKLGADILARGPSAFASISTLLSLPGADTIALGKKLRGVADRLVETAFRTVLKLDPRLAPVKVAIFPLKKNHEGIVAAARAILKDLQPHMRAVYDDTGAIGKLYRRQDEIGTPYCITVDFETLGEGQDGSSANSGTVTVRNRDTMKQERVPVTALRHWLSDRVGG
jgi:glycyl-tRNA synthetase